MLEHNFQIFYLKYNIMSIACRFLCFVLFYVFIFTVSTQKAVSKNSIFPTNGDIIRKQQINYIPQSEGGKDVIWDLSNVDLRKDYTTVIYGCVASHPTGVTGIENSIRYYYGITADTLTLNGVENNFMRIFYDRAFPEVIQPMKFGDSHSGYFNGRGTYCDEYMYRECGQYEYEVDAEGMLLLPYGDTIKNVVRTHSTRLSSTIFYTSDSLDIRAFNELFCDDSIASLISNDSTIIRTDTYRWYCSKSRYPLLEAQVLSHKGNAFKTMAYIQDTSQSEEYFCNNQNRIMQVQHHNNINVQENVNNHQPSAEIIQYKVTGSEYSAEITLTYRIFKQSLTTMTLYAPNGALVWKNTKESLSPGTYADYINLANRQKGVYLLYIETDKEQFSKKITII